MSAPSASTSRGLRLPLALFASAVLLFQIGWMISVPPYGQMDEIDHAYRAASVAHGHVTDHGSSPDARGALIRVPAPMVEAAHTACQRLKYMKPGNCAPLSSPDANGDVLVGSAAASYNPLYYAVVGYPAVMLAPDSGTAMVIVMRLLTALWCDLLIAAALLVTVRASRTMWPTLTVMATAMPVLLCASTAAAPNGVHMAAGLLMWTTMTALIFGADPPRRHGTTLIALWSLASSIVLVTHPTGPLWFVLNSTLGLLLVGTKRLRALVRAHRRASSIGAGVVVVVGVLTGLWMLLQHTLQYKVVLTGAPGMSSTPSSTTAAEHSSDVVYQFIVWILQCIGTVPFRNNSAPMIAYVVGLALIMSLIIPALLRAPRRLRWALGAVIVATLAISFVLNFVTYGIHDNGWQGRYTLAFSYGIPLLAGWMLAERHQRYRRFPPLLVAGALGLSVAFINAITLINVRTSITGPKWSALDGFGAPPTATVSGLAVAGGLLVVGAAMCLAQRAAVAVADHAS